LRYGLEQTSLHNDLINDIDKHSKNMNGDHQIKHNDIENYRNLFESEYKNVFYNLVILLYNFFF